MLLVFVQNVVSDKKIKNRFFANINSVVRAVERYVRGVSCHYTDDQLANNVSKHDAVEALLEVSKHY